MVLLGLKESIKKHEMSVEQLAVKSCMSSSTIFKACSGKPVTINTAKRIANALKLKLDDIQ